MCGVVWWDDKASAMGRQGECDGTTWRVRWDDMARAMGQHGECSDDMRNVMTTWGMSDTFRYCRCIREKKTARTRPNKDVFRLFLVGISVGMVISRLS
jgi:hypothetical protein